MLTIRSAQFAAFENSLFDQFIENLTDHVETRWIAFAGAVGGRQEVQVLVRASVARARALGFRMRSHFYTWVDWECEFGPAFHEKEEWGWCKAILNNGLDPAIRVYRIENRLRILRGKGLL
ncbi:MAG TPA: hypothetical protein VFQ91_16525 [Bryobacteraceae bacterium]|nr:hypothetical protein [Bryobacteraceae bacterium]